jgi:hypothetical protein
LVKASDLSRVFVWVFNKPGNLAMGTLTARAGEEIEPNVTYL